MQAVYIVGAGKYLPNSPVSNENLEHVLGTINGTSSRIKRRILASTGIDTRYYAIDASTRLQTHTNAQLTAAAVRGIRGRYDVPLDVDLLCSGTSSPDQLVPGHGPMVHGELKIPPLEVMTASGVCCSGVNALKYAYMSIAAGLSRRAITTASELVSNLFRCENFQAEMSMRAVDEAHPLLAFETDFLRFVLSDGAGALYLANEPAPGRLSLRLDWVEMFSFANKMPTCRRKLLNS